MQKGLKGISDRINRGLVIALENKEFDRIDIMQGDHGVSIDDADKAIFIGFDECNKKKIVRIMGREKEVKKNKEKPKFQKNKQKFC